MQEIDSIYLKFTNFFVSRLMKEISHFVFVLIIPREAYIHSIS